MPINKSSPNMSGYLWGIAQLVNDPSNDLVKAIRKRILGQPQAAESLTTHNATNGEDPKIKELEEKISLPVRTPATSGIKIKDETFKSKGIQVGQQPNKYRQVSVQCFNSTYPHDRKTTSVQHDRQAVPLFNRGICTYRMATTDAYTEPVEKKICKEHKNVILMLKNWSKYHKDQNSTDSKVFIQLKKSIIDFMNLLKIEKIQNIPEYFGPEKEIIKLYREASCNKLDKNKT